MFIVILIVLPVYFCNFSYLCLSQYQILVTFRLEKLGKLERLAALSHKQFSKRRDSLSMTFTETAD